MILWSFPQNCLAIAWTPLLYPKNCLAIFWFKIVFRQNSYRIGYHSGELSQCLKNYEIVLPGHDLCCTYCISYSRRGWKRLYTAWYTFLNFSHYSPSLFRCDHSFSTPDCLAIFCFMGSFCDSCLNFWLLTKKVYWYYLAFC